MYYSTPTVCVCVFWLTWTWETIQTLPPIHEVMMGMVHVSAEFQIISQHSMFILDILKNGKINYGNQDMIPIFKVNMNWWANALACAECRREWLPCSSISRSIGWTESKRFFFRILVGVNETRYKVINSLWPFRNHCHIITTAEMEQNMYCFQHINMKLCLFTAVSFFKGCAIISHSLFFISQSNLMLWKIIANMKVVK